MIGVVKHIESKRITAEFTITVPYFYSANNRKAEVKVLVDYRNKTFSIVPYSSGFNQQGFVFNNCNDRGAMWEAIGQAIIDATQLAKEELNNNK